jgi:NADP-dependent 3-hydroxy acid dehydrogenase YdfG
MANKTIFITGASSGIGQETAKYFAEKGWNVAATMRKVTEVNELLKYPNIKLYTLDVQDEQSIHLALEAALRDFGQIDVLYNNAGYALAGAFEALSQEQIQHQFATNVFGVMNMTRAILPHFRAKRNGVIINTTSSGGIITFPLYSIYNSTKWAVEGFMESLQFELKQFNIKIRNIEPATIRSNFEGSINFVSNPDYDSYAKKVQHNILASYKNSPTAAIVAPVVFKAANSSSNKLRYPVGQARLAFFMRWLLPLNVFKNVVASGVEKEIK